MNQFFRYLRQTKSPAIILLATAVMLLTVPGCSLFVMAGRMVLGESEIPAEFRKTTGTDLTESDDRVVIIATAPHRLLNAVPALERDIADRVTRILEARNVQVVPAGDVASWFDDNGEWGDYSEMAQEFDATYVIHIELREFDYRVPQSPHLLQGKTEGRITVHKIDESKDSAQPVAMVFDHNFRLKYPEAYPIQEETRSAKLFVEGFLDRTATSISQRFHDYRMHETVF